MDGKASFPSPQRLVINSRFGPTETLAVRLLVGYPAYTGRVAKIVAKAALDPFPTSPSLTKRNWREHSI